MFFTLGTYAMTPKWLLRNDNICIQLVHVLVFDTVHALIRLGLCITLVEFMHFFG